MIEILLILIILFNISLVLATQTSISFKKVDILYYVYLFNVVSIILWTLCILLLIKTNEGCIFLVVKLSHLFASTIASSLYIFTIIKLAKQFNTHKVYVVIISNIIISILIFFSDYVLLGVKYLKPFHEIVYGDLFFIYIFFIVFLFFRSFNNLYLASSLKYTPESKQMRLLFWGYLLSGLIAVPTNLMFPYFGYFELIWLGPVSTIILTIILTYTIRKFNFFNTKLLNIELFIHVVWLVQLISIYMAKGTFYTYETILAIVYIFGSLILIKKIKLQEEEKAIMRIVKGQLDDSIRVKNKITSLITHNLAGPLTSLKLYLEDVKNFREVLPFIDTLTSRVNDLSKLSNLDSNYKDTPEVFDVYELLVSILRNREIIAELKNVSFALKAEHRKILFSKNCLQESILSIINNILRNTTSDMIYLELHKSDDKFMIKIFDNSDRAHPKCPDELVKKFSSTLDVFVASIVAADLSLYVSNHELAKYSGNLLIIKKDNSKVIFIIEISNMQTFEI